MNGSPGGWHTQVQTDLRAHRAWVCIETFPNGTVKAESKEFSSKDPLRLSLSYSIYYLPGKQSTLSYIQYRIIIPLRQVFPMQNMERMP